MSYILEALKKSQQDRDLGQVPRLDTVVFDAKPAPVRRQPWIYATVALAFCAVVIALYAVLRGMPPFGAGPERGTPARVVGLPPSAAEERDRAVVAVPAAVASRPTAVSGLELEPGTGATALAGRDAEGPDPAPQAPALDVPESLSVQPEVLVVPAPPKPGAPLPRGADELRRAVLGPGSSPSVDVPRTPVDVPADHWPVPVRDNAPVPSDLIADIEKFKETVAAQAPASLPAVAQTDRQAAADTLVAAAETETTALPPPPSLALRNRLPELRMTVHIYDPDPARRLVYINGRKLTEKQTSTEGVALEQVVAEGAVLRWQGESFFLAR